MSIIEQRLTTLGLVLPPTPQLPPGVVMPFQAVRILGSRALVSGHGPQNADGTFTPQVVNESNGTPTARSTIP